MLSLQMLKFLPKLSHGEKQVARLQYERPDKLAFGF